MHRPTVASTALLCFAAGVCGFVALGLFWPDDGHADDANLAPAAAAADPQAASPANAKSTAANHQVEAADDIATLVTKLGDDLYAVRENASNQLVQKGIAARPQLLAALESSDAEVRFRAKHILSEVVEADFQKRLAAFSADVDGKLGLSMPGWNAFQQTAGSDRTARDLFVEVEQAEAPLLEAYEEGPKQAADKLRALLAEEPAVVDRAAALAAMKARRPFLPQSGGSSLGTILAWLLVAGDDAVPLTDDITARVVVLPQNVVFQQAAMVNIKQADAKAEVCRKILARWVARDISPIFAPYNLSFAYMFNLKEGLAPAIKILKQSTTTSDPISRYRAMFLVGKFGDKQHIALLEPFLKDTLVCFNSGGTNQPIQTQVRDIALLMSVRLAGQDPKDFGFDRWQNNEQAALNFNSIGFRSDEDRQAAFKKWEDWQAEQKPATGDEEGAKTPDEKSG